MVVVEGVKPVRPGPKGYRLVMLPLMDLTVVRCDRKTLKRFWVDVFFVDKVELISRRALTLHRPVEKVESVEVPEEALLRPSTLTPAKLYELLYEAYKTSKEIVDTHYSKMTRRLARWWRLRIIIPPAGQPPGPGEEVREATWAAAILKEALLLDGEEVKALTSVTSGGVFWKPFYVKAEEGRITVVDGGDERLCVNRRYTRLLEVDKGAREALEKALRHA